MPVTNNANDKNPPRARVAYLWESFKQGQSWAFRRIYLDMYDSLYLYGMRVLSSEAETKDLIQDLFVRLWNRRKRLPNVRNIKAYLFAAYRTMIIDFYRGKSNKIADSEFQPDAPGFSFTTEQQMIKDESDAELAHRLSNAIQSLTEREKEVIYLRFFQDLEYKEIARIMGIRYQSVRNLAHKALEALREIL